MCTHSELSEISCDDDVAFVPRVMTKFAEGYKLSSSVFSFVRVNSSVLVKLIPYLQSPVVFRSAQKTATSSFYEDLIVRVWRERGRGRERELLKSSPPLF